MELDKAKTNALYITGYAGHLFQCFLLRGDHPVLGVLPDVLVDVDAVDLHVAAVGDELGAAAALLRAQVDAEGEVERLERGAALAPALLRVHHQLPQTLVDNGVEECEVVEADGSTKNVLKIFHS